MYIYIYIYREREREREIERLFYARGERVFIYRESLERVFSHIEILNMCFHTYI